MERRGRKRKLNPNIPKHIDQDRLPKRCYWDNSGNGHWYTMFKDENGKSRRKWIANPSARLYELEEILENWDTPNIGSFSWLAEKYFESDIFKSLSKSTRKSYLYSFDVICQQDTKLGNKLSEVALNQWTNPVVQRFVDMLSDTPTKAKHVHGFIRLVFRWGKNRGYCDSNPAIGTELPKLKPKQTLPTQRAYDRLLELAKLRGTYGHKTTGSCPHYIWAIMEINYLCRARGVETRTMTDANLLEEGLLVSRTKGSRDNITLLNSRLESAVKFLQKARKAIWKRNGRALPIDPAERPLVVSTLGDWLTKSAYQNAWGRFVRNAIAEGVIDESERFTLHDLKRKGITDTEGGKQAKLEGGGHMEERMLKVYDKSVPIVKPSSD